MNLVTDGSVDPSLILVPFKIVPDARRIPHTIGPNTPSVERSVPCNAYRRNRPCTSPPFAIRLALSVHGKRSTRYPRKRAVPRPLVLARVRTAAMMTCLTKQPVFDPVDRAVRHPTIIPTITAKVRQPLRTREEDHRVHLVDIWGDTTITTTTTTTTTTT